MMAIKTALEARGEKRKIVLVPDSAHGTNPATAALLGYRVESMPVRADGTVDPEEVKKKLSPRGRRHHAHQPQHLRPVRARRGGDCRRRARGRRLLLRRRRQLQRHRRQGAPRRPRRRRHAHQPAQDVLHPARRRRAGRGTGGAVGGARPVHAGAVHDRGRLRRPLRGARGRSRRASPSAACAPSTARWACSCARWPTC